MSRLRIGQESISVNAWACAVCKTVHASKSEADGCCVCNDCGRKFQRESEWINMCPACTYGSTLREARKEVKRNAQRLRFSIERLGVLLSKPPDGKKKPKKGHDASLDQLLAQTEKMVSEET